MMYDPISPGHCFSMQCVTHLASSSFSGWEVFLFDLGGFMKCLLLSKGVTVRGVSRIFQKEGRQICDFVHRVV